mgnify:CR=1 FL=1
MAFIINSKYKDALLKAFHPVYGSQKVGALSLFFQPQVDLKTREVVGYEALLRWFDPTFGYVSPEKCLEIADFYRLTNDFNRWLIVQAVAGLQEISQHRHIAINLCAASLTLELAHDLLHALLKAKCDPSRLHIEITEHKAPKSFKELASTVAWMHNQGMRVALDDFGTGHATVRYLTYVDFDMIKIDKSYIQDIDKDRTKREILSHTLSLISASGASVLAEGVENEAEVAVLEDFNIPYAQGYLFGRPMSLGEVAVPTQKNVLLAYP